MWSFPAADETWVPYLAHEKGLDFEPAATQGICGALDALSALPGRNPARGLVLYNDTTEAAQFLAVTAGGLLDALPASPGLLARLPCLAAHLPAVYTIPPFETDAAAYLWAETVLLPNTSKTAQVRYPQWGCRMKKVAHCRIDEAPFSVLP